MKKLFIFFVSLMVATSASIHISSSGIREDEKEFIKLDFVEFVSRNKAEIEALKELDFFSREMEQSERIDKLLIQMLNSRSSIAIDLIRNDRDVFIEAYYKLRNHYLYEFKKPLRDYIRALERIITYCQHNKLFELFDKESDY